MRKYSKLSVASLVGQAVPPDPKPVFSEKQIEKIKTFSNVLLGILAVGGILTVAVLAPNAIQALEIFERKRRGRKGLSAKEKKRRVARAFYYLKDHKFIRLKKKGDDYEIRLTKWGRKQVRKLDLATLEVARPKKWDGKFWQVAADIPTEDYRNAADAFRMKIKEIKFYPLQRTLWFYPFDPRTEIEFIARTYGIYTFVTVMKIDQLEPADEKTLKSYFREEGII